MLQQPEGAALWHPDMVYCCVVRIKDERKNEALLVPLVDAKNRMTENLAISLRFQESIKKVSLFRHPEGSYRKHDPERKGWYQHLTKVRFIPVRFGQASF